MLIGRNNSRRLRILIHMSGIFLILNKKNENRAVMINRE